MLCKLLPPLLYIFSLAWHTPFKTFSINVGYKNHYDKSKLIKRYDMPISVAPGYLTASKGAIWCARFGQRQCLPRWQAPTWPGAARNHSYYLTCPQIASPSGMLLHVHQLALIEQLNDPNAAPEQTRAAACLWAAFELVGNKFENLYKISAWQQKNHMVEATGGRGKDLSTRW